MNDRPIIFTGPNVISILEGLKTQTRRLVKLPEGTRHVTVDLGGTDVFGPGPYVKAHRYLSEDEPGADLREAPMHPRIRCPYGYPGDRLWLKETWWNAEAYPYAGPSGEPLPAEKSRLVHYAAEGEPPITPNRHYPNGLRNGTFAAPDPWAVWVKRPSLYMPRWASRVTLEVTRVRVERLHAITEKDARAEGAYEALPSEGRAYDIALKEWCRWTKRLDPKARQGSQRGAYALLWERIHGAGAWAKNPWVWVIDFRRITA